jgi:hypothetical protein
MYILYFLYSFVAGIAAFFIFRTRLLLLLLFILIFEMMVYLIYLNFRLKWNIYERFTFNLFFLAGYYSFFILYEDFKDDDYQNFNNNIK